MSIGVLLADDQAMVRAGFRMILESDPGIAVVGEAANGEQALDSTRRLRPDVVLMDIQMPDGDGLQATRRITDEDELRSRVVILTTFERDDYVFEALQAGASGFLLKYAPPEELLRAVRVVAAGDALLAPSVTRRIIEQFAQRPVRPGLVTQLESLTQREREVLTLLARGKATPSWRPGCSSARARSRPTSRASWRSCKDIRAGVDFLQQRAEEDPSRIRLA